MVASQTPPPFPVTIPTAGLNKRDPLQSMDPSYCAWAKNWDPEPQFCKVRKGFVIHTTVSGCDLIRGLVDYGDSLFAYCDMNSGNHQIFDVSTTTASSVHTTGGTTNTAGLPFKFKARSAFVTSSNYANISRYWDGSTWNSWGFTYSGSAIGARTCLSYKGRVYMFASQSAYWGGLSAISGDTSLTDFSELFESPWEITWAGIISNSTNSVNETLMAFGNLAGEVLVFAGDYPDAANWELIARFQIGKSITYNGTLNFNGDLWVITETGIFSLRRLMQYGDSALDTVTVTSAINPYWTDLVRQVTDGNIVGFKAGASMTYWPQQNKIYCLMNGFLEEDGTLHDLGEAATLFVYNTISQAWQVQKISSVASGGIGFMRYHKDGLYYTTGNVVMRISPSVYKDETYNSAGNYSEYAIELYSAYQNYDSSKKFKKVEGFHPILKTDFAGSKLGMKAAADFGRKVSATSNVNLLDGFNNPLYSVGVDGNFLQYRLLGTSDSSSTDGYELYSMGVSAI